MQPCIFFTRSPSGRSCARQLLCCRQPPDRAYSNRTVDLRASDARTNAHGFRFYPSLRDHGHFHQRVFLSKGGNLNGIRIKDAARGIVAFEISALECKCGLVCGDSQY